MNVLLQNSVKSTFLNKTNAFRVSIEGAHDMPKIMGYPLVPLIFGSIFVGYIFKDMENVEF